MLNLKVAYSKSAPSSPWRAISWRDLPVLDLPEPSELFDLSAKNCYALIEEERMYENFYKDCGQIVVPIVPNTSVVDYTVYISLLDNLETDAIISPELILDAIVEQVSKLVPAKTTEGENASPTEVLEANDAKNELLSHVSIYFEKALSAIQSTELTPAQLDSLSSDIPSLKFVYYLLHMN